MKTMQARFICCRRRLLTDWLIWAIACTFITTAVDVIADPATQSDSVVSDPRSGTSNGTLAEANELVATFDRALVALSRSMLVWIGERTDFAVDALIADPPSIVFALVGDTILIEDAALPVSATLHGAYSHTGNVVVLVLPWHIDDPVDRSILLHELTHAVQISAVDWRCVEETEWDTYQLQREWLAEHGIELQLDWILIGILSRCTDASP